MSIYGSLFHGRSVIRVLSLFDGCAGARQALDMLGVECTYFASEIDKYAIQIANQNYPDIIQLGDITKLDEDNLPRNIDLLVGGSPCQSLSRASNNKNSGLETGASTLFWEYIRVLKAVKPRYFLLENVASMKQADRDKISEILGVQPVLINSALLTGQNRRRYYWANFPITQPEDRGVVLKDILESTVDDSFIVNTDKQRGVLSSIKVKENIIDVNNKSRTLTTKTGNASSFCNTLIYVGCATTKDRVKDGKVHLSRNCPQGDRIYDSEGLSATLSANAGGSGGKTGLYQVDGLIRRLTPVECERLQGMRDNYTEGVSNTQRYKSIGNGFTVPVIAHILKGILCT